MQPDQGIAPLRGQPGNGICDTHVHRDHVAYAGQRQYLSDFPRAEISRYVGHQPHDDMALLLIERTAPPRHPTRLG